MPPLKLALLAADREELAAVKAQIQGVLAADIVALHDSLPSNPADPMLQRVLESRPEVALICIAHGASNAGFATMELLRSADPDLAVFAAGPMDRPKTIIYAMRAGACEYLDRQHIAEGLVDALSRLGSSHKRTGHGAGRGQVITFLSAKGGCGATTLAVNTATVLQKQFGNIALVDLATLPHIPVHLDVKPVFGWLDALRNRHRLDATLLDSLLTECPGGMRLLAAPNLPSFEQVDSTSFMPVFDLLVAKYKYVIVDCSTRLDKATRAVCDLSSLVLLVSQADVPSLWSAARVQALLSDILDSKRLRLVLNRFRKIAGFRDEDAESATNCKLFWKMPNQFSAVSPAIDRGSPVALQNSLEISQSFRDLAAAIVRAAETRNGNPQPSRKAPEPNRRLQRLISLAPDPARSRS